MEFRKGLVECLTKIPRCDSLKLLGVHFDSNFGFKTHMEKLLLKGSQLSFQMNRLRKHAFSIRNAVYFQSHCFAFYNILCLCLWRNPQKAPQEIFLSHSSCKKVTTRHRRYWFQQNKNNLRAKCWEKVCKRRNTFLQIWFLFNSPIQPRSWEEDPHQQILLVCRISTYSQIAAWE